MTYAGDKFWENYKEYAEESRDRHQKMFNLIARELQIARKPAKVLDLGCGKTCSARNLMKSPVQYLGLDLYPPDDRDCRTGNYADKKELEVVLNLFQPDFVVSLFSLDVVLPPSTASEIKEQCALHPNVKAIISAGFYYDTDALRDQSTVEEVGDVTSFQARRGHLPTSVKEIRIEQRGPSRMFGLDVVEVFTRTSKL